MGTGNFYSEVAVIHLLRYLKRVQGIAPRSRKQCYYFQVGVTASQAYLQGKAEEMNAHLSGAAQEGLKQTVLPAMSRLTSLQPTVGHVAARNACSFGGKSLSVTPPSIL